jgi:hypothetical protein
MQRERGETDKGFYAGRSRRREGTGRKARKGGEGEGFKRIRTKTSRIWSLPDIAMKHDSGELRRYRTWSRCCLTSSTVQSDLLCGCLTVSRHLSSSSSWHLMSRIPNRPHPLGSQTLYTAIVCKNLCLIHIFYVINCKTCDSKYDITL